MPTTRVNNKLPLILCGPMLRRVERKQVDSDPESTSVSVFVALRFPRQICLTVYDDYGEVFSGGRDTIPLGKYLHVAVVTAKTTESSKQLDWGGRFEYDLSFKKYPTQLYETKYPGLDAEDKGVNFDKNDTMLSDWGLLDGEHALGYEAGKRPHFLMPPEKLEELRIVHSSCRKPHGKGRDALAFVDEVIAGNVASLERPHQLWLTGDQIYADDVALSLLRILTETGKQLLGWYETLPASSGSSDHALNADWDANFLRGIKRGAYVREQGKYTSGESDGHLIYLAEFYAMYLMVWSDVLWPRKNGGYDLPEKYDSFRAEDCQSWSGMNVTKLVENRLPTNRTAALNLAKTLPKVRRLLANVPTYMMFDDHEVTDDWYLHWDWTKKTRGSVAGRRLMRNALLAYAVFQDWGNQPEKYETGFGQTLLEKITYNGAAASPPPIHTHPEDEELIDLLDLHPTDAAPKPRIRWDYQVFGHRHKVIALDTRTWRVYPPHAKDKGSAGLLSSQAMELQLTKRKSSDLLTLIISPAPFIGVPTIERAQQVYIFFTNEEAGDDEPWGGNPPIFQEFLKRLGDFGSAILLSGDVHYAFSSHVAYFHQDATTPESARIIQLCSSAQKNQDGKTKMAGSIGHLLHHRRTGWLGFEGQFEQRVRDEMRKELSQMDWWERLGAMGDSKYHVRFDLVRYDQFGPPAVIRSDVWGSDDSDNELVDDVKELAELADWQYTITHLRDEREDTHRQAEAWRGPGITVDPTDLEKSSDDLRDVVGYNNIGFISFQTDGGGSVTTVKHRLAWYDDKIDKDVVFFTEHVAPLTRPTDDERPEVK